MRRVCQIDAAERYLRKIEEKKDTSNIKFLITLIGISFFIACSYLAFILKSTNE